MSATHILDGQELIEKQDAVGRRYFVAADGGKRVKTSGLEPTPLLAADTSDLASVDPHDRTDEDTAAEIARMIAEGAPLLGEDEDPFADVLDDWGADEPLPIPEEISFEHYSIAVEAHLRMYAHRRAVSARSNGDGSVTLSLPAPDGGHRRYILRFPEFMPVVLIPVEE